MDFAELKKKTVTQLKEMAAEYPDITGVSGMKKDQLLDAIAGKMGIEKEAAKAKPAKKKTTGKGAIKKRIKELKSLRSKALEEKDADTLHKVRRLLHRQKVVLRRIVARS